MVFKIKVALGILAVGLFINTIAESYCCGGVMNLQIPRVIPYNGTKTLLVIYACGENDYDDAKRILPNWFKGIWGYPNPDTGLPNMHDYIDKVSRSNLDLEPRILWDSSNVSTPRCIVVDGENTPCGGWGSDALWKEFVGALIAQLDPTVDFSDYSDNTDTVAIGVIAWSYNNWGYSYGGCIRVDTTNDFFNGKQVKVFTTFVSGKGGDSPGYPQSAYRNRRSGVWVHELGHQLCVSDTYRDPDGDFCGSFDCMYMPNGFWNTDTFDFRPSPYALCWQQRFGWLPKLDTIIGHRTDFTIQNIKNNKVYVIGNRRVAPDSEYFMITNHRKQFANYYEWYWPGNGGLMVWHGTSGMGITGNGKCFDIECGHGLWQWNGRTNTGIPDPVNGKDSLDIHLIYDSSDPRYKGVGSVSCYFQPNDAVNRFTTFTNPSSDFHDFSDPSWRQDVISHIGMKNLRISGDKFIADIYTDCIQTDHFASMATSSQRKLANWGQIYYMVYPAKGNIYYTFFPASDSLQLTAGVCLGQGEYPAIGLYVLASSRVPCSVWKYDGQILFSRWATSGWSSPVTLPGPTNPGPPSMAVDHSSSPLYDTVHICYITNSIDTAHSGVRCALVHIWFDAVSPGNAQIETVDEGIYTNGWGIGVSTVTDTFHRLYAVYSSGDPNPGYPNQGLWYKIWYRTEGGWRSWTNRQAISRGIAGFPFIDRHVFSEGADSLQVVWEEKYPEPLETSRIVYSSVPVPRIIDDTTDILPLSAPRNIDKTCNPSRFPQISGGDYVTWSDYLYNPPQWDVFYRRLSWDTTIEPHNLSDSPTFSLFPNTITGLINRPGNQDTITFYVWQEGNSSPFDIIICPPREHGHGHGGPHEFGQSASLTEPMFSMYPNPAKNTITIRCSVSNVPVKDISITIFDINGRKVRILSLDPSGLSEWDTKDDNGKMLSSGVYFVQLKIAEVLSNKKITLIR